jgi:hypothetical protein
MKTIILSLTIVLAQLVSPAFAQIVKSYDGNNNVIYSPAKDYTQVNYQVAEPVENILWDAPDTHPVITRKLKIAKYISELEFLARETNTGSINNATAYKRNNIKNRIK